MITHSPHPHPKSPSRIQKSNMIDKLPLVIAFSPLFCFLISLPFFSGNIYQKFVLESLIKSWFLEEPKLKQKNIVRSQNFSSFQLHTYISLSGRYLILIPTQGSGLHVISLWVVLFSHSVVSDSL